MYCPKCGNKIDKNDRLCSSCGFKLQEYDGFSAPSTGKNTSESVNGRNKKHFIAISALIAGIILIFGIGVSIFKFNFNANKNEIDEDAYNAYLDYDNQLLDIEQNYLNGSGYVDDSDVSSLLDKAEEKIKQGVKENVISEYIRDDSNIYIKFSSGISYLFIPYQEDALSVGDECKILTLEPTGYDISVRYSSVLAKIDTLYNDIPFEESLWPESNASMIEKAYSLNSNTSIKTQSLKDLSVTVEQFKNLSDYSIVIFEGHGAYNEKIHSALVTGESYVGFKDLSKYCDDLANDTIVLTSFPKIGNTKVAYSPVRSYCITSKFIDKYMNEMNHSLVFLGSCSSLKDEVLANSLIGKGADVVMGYTDITSMQYEMISRSLFFYNMVHGGENINVAEAYQKTIKTIGVDYLNQNGNPAKLTYIYREGMNTECTINKIFGATQNEYSEKDTIKDNRTLFKEKLSMIKSEYKIFKSNQTGVMNEWSDNWFDPGGVISANIEDFDSDGLEEMLVCTSEKCKDRDDNDISGNNEEYNIILSMYEIENGNVGVADTFTLGAYVDSKYMDTNKKEVILSTNNWSEEICAINCLTVSDNKYIVCEDRVENNLFANAYYRAYWLLEYNGNSIQYAASFAQTGLGSSDFQYKGYNFKDGVCINSDLYYSESPPELYYENETPLYNKYEDSIKAFFDKYGIVLKDKFPMYETILSTENDITPIFTFTNKLDWSGNANSFSAKLDRGSNLIDTNT